MTHSMLGVFGMGGGELLIVLLGLLLFGGFIVLVVGLAIALAMRLNKKTETQPLTKEPPPSPPVNSPPVAETANLAASRFHDVNLASAEFDNVNLTNARFTNVNLSNATIVGAQLGGTTFRHIGPPPDASGVQDRQRPVRFEEMMLCDSIFRKVDLSNVRISDCDLTGTTIDGVLVSDMIAAYKKQGTSVSAGLEEPPNRGPEGGEPTPGDRL